MRTPFVESVLERVQKDEILATPDSVIAVCAGEREREVFADLGFWDALITNLDDRLSGEDVFTPFRRNLQDAQNLDVADAPFDAASAAGGLRQGRSSEGSETRWR